MRLLDFIFHFVRRWKLRIIIPSLFVFCFIFSFLFFLLPRFFKLNEKREEEIAIIFVPGIGCSGLFNTSPKSLKYKLNSNIWLYGDEYTMGNFWSSDDSKKNILETNYDDFFCNQFGVPVNADIKSLNTVAEGMALKDAKMVLYGYERAFEPIIQLLKHYLSLYSLKHIDIFMFNYDWRLSVKENALLLKQEIEKYTDVVLVGYSLGGLVSINAFYELEKAGTLSKVKGFIACAVPFLGSYKACHALMNGDIFFYVPSGIKDRIKNICRNYSSMYDLLPSSFFSKNFIGNKECLQRLVYFDFNMRLFADALISNRKRNMFAWYSKVPNLYVINGEGGGKVLDVDDFNMFLRGSFSTFVPGDGTVASKSSFPPFLKKHVKDFFTVKCSHKDVMTNNLVQFKIIDYISYILNIRKDSTSIETFYDVLRENDFRLFEYAHNN